MNDFLHGEYLAKDSNLIQKEEFIRRLKIWRQLTKSKTIGNTTIEQGRSTLFKVEENGNNVWNVHSDTKREAVNQFLDQRGNPWKKAIGPKGSIVLTNNEDGTYIEGFYMYLNR